MPEWCPQCHAMLPEGLETCPSCGARLPRTEKSKIASLDQAGAPAEIGGKEIAWLSAYVIGIALIPILLAVILGVICVLVGSR